MGLIILNTAWWIDVKAANGSTHLRPSQKMDVDRYAAYQEFVKDMNLRDAPLQARIAPKTN
jgi:hypothetical protein